LGPAPDSTDYPDYAAAVGRRVAEGSVDRGILVCSTGVGMSIAANKIPGVRAALAVNEEEGPSHPRPQRRQRPRLRRPLHPVDRRSN
jgi:RpiB/LacA/LacB family sugar-phosphate isomerase